MNDERLDNDIAVRHRRELVFEREQEIRYEVQCRFCARYISGGSAIEAAENIVNHDVSHPFCGRCRTARAINPSVDPLYCDDCAQDVGARERATA